MDNNAKIKQVFCQALGIQPEQVTDDLTYNTIEQWDSTAHMILVAELEDSFDVMLDTDDIIDMSTVGKAKEILAKYDIQF
ncbi:acyl carrier protein [Alteromonas ponticola]|uniref:Acyl carrier protein n=1 Tax=Alteromonas aquimaris TaxID=2998417 RepID=A0ABT3P4A2_9ALTE|nr:acyl carrier protein [Alteromonas aquimaris]MCW8107604.1 acyl carrier protein [Alteromonas aquimaris]